MAGTARPPFSETVTESSAPLRTTWGSQSASSGSGETVVCTAMVNEPSPVEFIARQAVGLADSLLPWSAQLPPLPGASRRPKETLNRALALST
mmetsp:Transcript_753/g.1979  ORF Transcript_753/g.1979 Transcript_753/m.1979 type:complete len:93 (-) Transcript_753:43-321(-)